jgi:transposase InsO family protein
MPSSSISGYVYYVSFIDDYSHKDLDIFEVFSKFKEFKSLIENLSVRKILRSDNGGEYTSKEFVNFCKDVGIKRELTTPYSPQQNGVVERKNRTMLEAVKIKIFLCAYGQKQQWKLYMYRTDCPIMHLGPRHRKRCSPKRSQR